MVSTTDQNSIFGHKTKKEKKIALSLDDEPPFLFPPWEWLIQRKVSENPTKLLFS